MIFPQIPTHLKISQLHRRGTLGNGFWGFLQSSSSFLFTVRCDHLGLELIVAFIKSKSSVFILTLALASLAASASAAMALCSWTGSRQSLLKWFWFCFVRRGTLRHQRAHRDHSQHSELSRSRLVYTRPELRAQLRRFRAHMLLMLLIQRYHATLIGQLKLKWLQAKRRELRRHLNLTLLS